MSNWNASLNVQTKGTESRNKQYNKTEDFFFSIDSKGRFYIGHRIKSTVPTHNSNVIKYSKNFLTFTLSCTWTRNSQFTRTTVLLRVRETWRKKDWKRETLLQAIPHIDQTLDPS